MKKLQNGYNGVEWVTSGVPQGSVLRLLLFLYVNDIAETIQCDSEVLLVTLRYTQLLRLLKILLSFNKNKLQDWSKLSLLSLKVDKCKVMHITTLRIMSRILLHQGAPQV